MFTVNQCLAQTPTCDDDATCSLDYSNGDIDQTCTCNDGFIGTRTQAGLHIFRSTGGTQLVFVI